LLGARQWSNEGRERGVGGLTAWLGPCLSINAFSSFPISFLDFSPRNTAHQNASLSLSLRSRVPPLDISASVYRVRDQKTLFPVPRRCSRRGTRAWRFLTQPMGFQKKRSIRLLHMLEKFSAHEVTWTTRCRFHGRGWRWKKLHFPVEVRHSKFGHEEGFLQSQLLLMAPP
jgi:hypothetical protein